ncbi:hypothetical protein LSG31_01015 [Fodinisporobacter ferrooxydans]|uniref:Uncharacterized protein n=1 Tax=Fodinisporobacter ferrooxydans TaxID=2901836 RepID=A0ABY4CKU4_9BACL|nr:hypothetical protein LSG31_01015 [Alicyclobacillaceae bacterium MYW30-H2]
MENNNGRKSESGLRALAGISGIAVICCGLPVLLGAIGFTALSTFMIAQRYWIFGGMVLVMGMIMLILSIRKRKFQRNDCCRIPTDNQHSL